MEKKKLLQQLEQNAEAYRCYRPATADMDIDIFRAYCTGKGACEIAMEIPCSDSTVYRALRRVQEFLREQDAASIMDALRAFFTEWTSNSGSSDEQSLLELLYATYIDCNNMYYSHTKDGFASLRRLLGGLSETLMDSVYDAVCDLCLSHEQAGFTEGIKVGVRLCNELEL